MPTLAWQRFGTPGAGNVLLAHGEGGPRGTQTAAIPLPGAGSSPATHCRARVPQEREPASLSSAAPGIEVTGSPGTQIADVTPAWAHTRVKGVLSCCRLAAAGSAEVMMTAKITIERASPHTVRMTLTADIQISGSTSLLAGRELPGSTVSRGRGSQPA